MNGSHDVVDRGPSPLPPAVDRPVRLPRWLAAFEVVLVSGVPTQILVYGALAAASGWRLPTDGRVSVDVVTLVSLVDTALVISLILMFLRLTGERPLAVFVGSRPWRRDALKGLALVPIVFVAVTAVVLTLRAFVPSTHTVPTSPFDAFLDAPASAIAFLIVVIVAGGVREELQRAFVLHRFDAYLGGTRVGLVLFSVLFGALHIEQGVDVAIAIGCLGLAWGAIYIRYRSAVMPMVNHAAFNTVQVLQALAVKSVAG